MKTCLITVVFILLSVKLFAQFKGEVTAYYGITNTITPTTGTDTYAYRITGAPIYGATIGGRLFNNLPWFSLETGIFFANNKSQFTQLSNGSNVVNPTGEVEMWIIPFYAKFTFLKYLFVYGGFSFDTQSNELTDGIQQSQSGFGVEAGFGAKYKTGHMLFSIAPFIFNHEVLHVGNNNSNNELIENGVKFGVGYAF